MGGACPRMAKPIQGGVIHPKFSARAKKANTSSRGASTRVVWVSTWLARRAPGALSVGATIVLPAPSFDARLTLEAVQAERCTVLHGVPTMFISQLNVPEFGQFNLSSLHTGIMAGAPCPVDVMQRVINEMHMADILIAYGMTESSPVATITSVHDTLDRRVRTVGRVMPHQEIKIINPETGRIAPRGETGEVCFRGYHVMARYDHNPEATAEAVDDKGWLHSGDLGVMDEDGYVAIVGRIKDMVIRGGENIYPREIEEFLRTLDVVYDVAVVGVPDEKYGEELCACIKLHPDVETPSDDEFRAMCVDEIAHFKIPHYWMIVDDFPMTVTGKIQKFRLRELAMDFAQAKVRERESVAAG